MPEWDKVKLRKIWTGILTSPSMLIAIFLDLPPETTPEQASSTKEILAPMLTSNKGDNGACSDVTGQTLAVCRLKLKTKSAEYLHTGITF